MEDRCKVGMCIIKKAVKFYITTEFQTKGTHYEERLPRLDLQSLELRRLHVDLIWCYKVVFGLVDIDMNCVFQV